MVKLRDLATQVNAVLPRHWHFPPEQIYASLDVRGEPYNEHLGNPLNRISRRHCNVRPVALTGDEEVQGRFHTFDYNDHDPYLYLTSYGSLDQMVSSILSDRGILNSYLTFMLAFIDGVFVPYMIYFQSGEQWLVFDKCKTGIFEDVTENGVRVRIEWLEAASRCTISQYEYDR